MHPVLIQLGPLAIHTYGVMVALGFILGIALAAHRAKQAGIDPQRINDLGIWLIVAGMLGGKLFYILFYWRDFSESLHSRGIAALREGFVFFGGFIGASLTAVWYARRKQLPLWKLADALAPSVALGHAFGRIGCFFEGCCYGKACTLPWAVQFPGLPTTVHPTQLYEAAGNFAIAAGLSLFYHRKKFDGQVWWLYVLLYGALRFTNEFFRGDYPVYYLGVLTSAHLIAALLMLIAAVGYQWSRRTGQRLPAA